MSPEWTLRDEDGLWLIRCRPLAEVAGIAHAFATRRADGGDGLDAGAPDSPDVRPAEARRRVIRAAGIAASDPILLRQVHGATAVDVREGPGPVEGDAAVWSGSRGPFAPAVRTADCVPVLVASLDGTAAAAIHAGWRGVRAGIVAAALSELERRGAPSGSLVAAVGPAIGPCCFEVGPEVVDEVLRAIPSAEERDLVDRAGATARAHLDLPRAVAFQLSAAGVATERVHVARWCTRCRADLFHSFRRDGARAGRMLAVAGPASRP